MGAVLEGTVAGTITSSSLAADSFLEMNKEANEVFTNTEASDQEKAIAIDNILSDKYGITQESSKILS